nr:hypothetical protein HYE49_02845 [Mycoplasmopsis bovis]
MIIAFRKSNLIAEEFLEWWWWTKYILIMFVQNFVLINVGYNNFLLKKFNYKQI